MTQCGVRSQFGGNNNRIFYNVWKFNPAAHRNGGLLLTGSFSGRGTSRSNAVLNNVLAHIAGSGIGLNAGGGLKKGEDKGFVEHNVVKNNILYKCGSNAGGAGMYIADWAVHLNKNYGVRHNIIENNIIYHPKYAKPVHVQREKTEG